MNTNSLWTALRAKLGIAGGATSQGRAIALQHLVLSQREIAAVQEALDRVGEQLSVRFELQAQAGDIVLLDAERAAQIAPQVVEAFTDGRPVVKLSNMRHDDELQVPASTRLLAREAELLRQLREIPLVRDRAARRGRTTQVVTAGESMLSEHSHHSTQTGTSTAFDTGFDSRMDADQLASLELNRAQQVFLKSLLRGMDTPGSAALCASYGENANLRLDFSTRRVHIDPLAEQYLRVQIELPQAAPSARPQLHASVRDLHEVVWELGLAAGACEPVGAPPNWWHAPLQLRVDARVDRYTRHPRHLAMGLLLAAGHQTPSALRARARANVTDVRRFIQACLMSGLVHWGPTPSTQETPR